MHKSTLNYDYQSFNRKLVMRKWISYSLTGLLALLCCACNSDIFLEPAPDIEDNMCYPISGIMAEIRQPGSGLTFYLSGKCQLRQPISYNIEKQ